MSCIFRGRKQDTTQNRLTCRSKTKAEPCRRRYTLGEMNRTIFIILILPFFLVHVSFAFDFEVQCDEDIANSEKISKYFQRYIGRWEGAWEKDENLNLYPERIRKIAEKFNYSDHFLLEVVSINGCEARFNVYYENRKKYTYYQAEVMTEEGYYIYWNSPTIKGTYILMHDEERDILEGIFQLFEGQNIAKIYMKRL